MSLCRRQSCSGPGPVSESALCRNRNSLGTQWSGSGDRFASMTSVRTITALAVVLGLALSGCTPSSPDLPPEADLQLSPHGDDGKWLDDAYAAGIEGQYATPNEVCAVTGDVVVEVERGTGGDSTVMGRDLRGGEILWEIDDATCGQGALLPGDADSTTPAAASATVAIGTQWLSAKRAWSLYDPATGTERQALGLGPEVSSVRPLAWAGTRVVVQTGIEDLIGIDMGTSGDRGDEKWSTPVAAGAQVTVLADGFLGVTDQLGKRISVIALDSGEVRLTTDVARPDRITWASDGYVEKIDETDPEYAFFDLDGREIDRTKGITQYPFVPAPRDGVTFPIADHRKAGTVVGVSAAGTPALFQDERQRDFTQAGEAEDLPGSIIGLLGVSADGSLLLFDRGPDGLVLIDETGAEVGEWPLDYSELRVESGLLVVSGGSGTTVLLPSGA